MNEITESSKQTGTDQFRGEPVVTARRAAFATIPQARIIVSAPVVKTRGEKKQKTDNDNFM